MATEKVQATTTKDMGDKTLSAVRAVRTRPAYLELRNNSYLMIWTPPRVEIVSARLLSLTGRLR